MWPAPVFTTRRPSPSIPAAVPPPPVHETGRPRSASRVRTDSRTAWSSATVQCARLVRRRCSVSSIASGGLRSDAAVFCSSGGKSSGASATFSPMPRIAQPAWGRLSTRMPATLRFLIRTSLGHLIWAGWSSSSHSSATAAPAARGRSRFGFRISSERRRARFGGAVQERPWRPRPAVCSEAVTRVPWGAPWGASSRRRSLVESVRR